MVRLPSVRRLRTANAAGKISLVQQVPAAADGPARRNRAKFIYFASSAVAVDSSHMTALSSASWSRFSPPSNFVNGHVSTMWFMVCRWPQSHEGDWARPHLCIQVSTTWALTCPETVHRRPCMTKNIETWLSDSRRQRLTISVIN